MTESPIIAKFIQPLIKLNSKLNTLNHNTNENRMAISLKYPILLRLSAITSAIRSLPIKVFKKWRLIEVDEM